MPCIIFSIGGEEHDITGKSSKEILDVVKKEYNKKKKIKFNVKGRKSLSIIPFKTMREIVKLECEGRQGWNEGSASSQEYFIDNMTKLKEEQYKSFDDKIEGLLNKIVFPEEMIKEALKPKKKKIKFNVKGRV